MTIVGNPNLVERSEATSAGGDGPASISDALSELKSADESARIDVESIRDALGDRAFGPLFFLIGAISASPLGAVPGLSIVFGVIVVLLGLQMFAGEHRLWLPKRILKISTDRDRFAETLEKMEPWVERIERIVTARFTRFTERPWSYGVAVVVTLIGLSFFPLALVPWGVTPPSLALMLIGAAMTNRDGAVVLAGQAIALSTLLALAWATGAF
ncbi:MAG: exopolysaccharide biosynthesis protein [Pseudomonadota bacterium]